MKVALDLSKLVEQGKLSRAEAERLRVLAAGDTNVLAVNILIGFGVVAVTAGAVALLPTPEVVLGLGLAIFAIGLALDFWGGRQWSLLAQICLVVGALGFSGGLLLIGKGTRTTTFIVAAALAAAALVARSSLLMAAAVLTLGVCLGAGAGYWDATYTFSIYEPLVTIVLFSLLALAIYHLSKSLAADYERLALTAARTCVLIVNLGFWIGSLGGDDLILVRSLLHADMPDMTNSAVDSVLIPPLAFVIAWALALLGACIWGARQNRRWLVNLAAVFGAVDFYTQWFVWLGAEPLSLLVGGLLMLGFALALRSLNLRLAAQPQ